MVMFDRPSYYAIIPAGVRYDKLLSPYARLLYGEISSLCNKKGYCWSTNEYFANLYAVTKTTISTWVSALENRGHIRTEFGKGNSRRIYIVDCINTQLNSEEVLGQSTIPLKDCLNHNIKDNTKKNSKDNNSISRLDDPDEIIQIVYDFWNSCKNEGKWQSHRKLTFDMTKAITSALKEHTVLEICGAIGNYATVLQGKGYYWDYMWPLAIFLTVKTGKSKDDPKKWWRFLEENFIEDTYLSRYNNGNSNNGVKEELPPDPDPKLTEMITEAYRKEYRPGGDFPNFTAQKHFRLVCTKAKKKYKLDSVAFKTTFVVELFQIAQDTWSSKGEEVMPWDLSGTLMWDYKIPQYYQNMGVPESLIGEIR